jgi:hypothetical protein
MSKKIAVQIMLTEEVLELLHQRARDEQITQGDVVTELLTGEPCHNKGPKKPVQIRLPKEWDRYLRETARRENKSLGEVVSEAIHCLQETMAEQAARAAV